MGSCFANGRKDSASMSTERSSASRNMQQERTQQQTASQSKEATRMTEWHQRVVQCTAPPTACPRVCLFSNLLHT